ncbi:DUF559 domain-containing protein [Cochleicola gelatinilyticus]|uniref:DUF559 domain-containing protein n=1 Tax=Cochleicola gelatinilyticus TaxID=1763537 RepID=UPI000B27097E|nr:DUF559 domain-containing protein [Cochleicola gelatinilyticus]
MKKPNKIAIARHLRQQQTPAEKELWTVLRNRNFENLKFRRQHPIKEYIVDFYCDALRLIIELDEGYHNNGEQKERDHLRDLHLQKLGYHVLRFQNKVVFEDLNSIYEAIKKLQPLSPSQRERDGVRGLSILSTKKLLLNQKELLLNARVSLVEYDAISIEYLDFEAPSVIENAIFTSQNGVRAVENLGLKIENCFCVGKKTKALLETKGQNVIKTSEYGAELAAYIVKNYKKESFYQFCGTIRREEIPSELNKANIPLTEITTYQTVLKPKKFERIFDAVLFFSPSGVQSFLLENDSTNSPVICIGTTTASEAKKYFKNVVIANATTVESVIAKAIKTIKN